MNDMINTIAFPGLGLEFEVNRVAFTLFSRPVFWYALCIMTGVILGLLFVMATSKKRGLESDHVLDICFWGLIAGIIGARIFYCIFDWESVGGFAGIFKIWEGGLAIYGGVIGAVISTFIYCKVKKLNILNTFDVCVPGLMIGQMIGRWGNFFNAEVYGHETESLLRMTINDGEGVHPLFLYESLWNLLGLALLLLFRKRKKADGQVFCFYIFWYGLGRLFLEGMRQPQYILYLIPNVLGISQVVALLGIILGISGKVYLGVKAKKKDDTEIEVEIFEEPAVSEETETLEETEEIEESEASVDEVINEDETKNTEE